MERILVGIHAGLGFRDALSRAVSLTGRIRAKLYVLVVFSEDSRETATDMELERSVRSRLELLQHNSPPDKRVELYLARGKYEEEVIRFANQHNITLLVAEMDELDPSGGHRESRSLEQLRHRLRCRVELITPKRSKSVKQQARGEFQ